MIVACLGWEYGQEQMGIALTNRTKTGTILKTLSTTPLGLKHMKIKLLLDVEMGLSNSSMPP
jgi:hypothetical protein